MFVRTAGAQDIKAIRALLIETWHATYDSIYGVEKVTEITDRAREEGYDLLVVATHGYSGIKRAFLGSVAERIVRTAPCPVLVVRGTGE